MEFFTRIPEVNKMNEKLANPAPLGLSAFHLAIAEALNEIYGKTLMPV